MTMERIDSGSSGRYNQPSLGLGPIESLYFDPFFDMERRITITDNNQTDNEPSSESPVSGEQKEALEGVSISLDGHYANVLRMIQRATKRSRQESTINYGNTPQGYENLQKKYDGLGENPTAQDVIDGAKRGVKNYYDDMGELLLVDELIKAGFDAADVRRMSKESADKIYREFTGPQNEKKRDRVRRELDKKIKEHPDYLNKKVDGFLE